MTPLRKLYLDFYLFVYALYAFFNKGIAYSYLSEVLWVLGLLFVLKDLRKNEWLWTRSVQLLVGFLLVSALYIVRGVTAYPAGEVIRDSFMLNYAAFVFILFYFKEHIPYLLNGLYKIYAFFPIVALVSFLLISFVPFFETFVLFGEIPLLIYKYNDMAAHLLITCLFMINGNIQLSKKFTLLNGIILLYLLLVLSAYNRSGMLAFLVSAFVFYRFTNQDKIRQWLRQNLRYLPLLALVAVSLYATTQVKENFQGRKIGLAQLKENAVSIVSTNTDGTLNDNKIWRLTWWAKIIDDSFSSPRFLLFGRGYGMSLADANEVPHEEDTLRSPHSIHFNYLARFGYPFVLAWLLWIGLLFRPLFRQRTDATGITYLSILLAFLINASFDVYFEGPMGAFPFWTFVGLFYIHQWNGAKQEIQA